MDKAWKRFERSVAKYTGGERVPITGRQRGDKPDVDHAWLSIECKYRKKLPEWILDAMDQAEASAKPRQLPVVILGEKGGAIGDALVVCTLREFREHWL